MQDQQLVQGRSVRPEDIDWLRGWIQAHPQWSRKRLARQLCELWQWRDERGRIKDFAARSFLLKLQAQGQLTLPALQVHQRRGPRPAPTLPNWQEPTPWSGALADLRPVSLMPVQPGTSAAREWAFYLHHKHYMGMRVVGENLG